MPRVSLTSSPHQLLARGHQDLATFTTKTRSAVSTTGSYARIVLFQGERSASTSTCIKKMFQKKETENNKNLAGTKYRIMLKLTRKTRVKTHHSPWDEFQRRFSPKRALGGTHNEKGVGKIWSRYFQRRVGRRLFSLSLSLSPLSTNQLLLILIINNNTTTTTTTTNSQ